jgi:dihydrofolate reductase
MSMVTCNLSISLDGFVAGPNQSLDDPIGEGGMRLHDWMFDTQAWRDLHGHKGGGSSTPDSDAVVEMSANVGAYIMGRKMFGGGDGELDRVVGRRTPVPHAGVRADPPSAPPAPPGSDDI